MEIAELFTLTWDLEVIEGGDHSFRVPKSNPVSKEDTYAQILKAAMGWFIKNLKF